MSSASILELSLGHAMCPCTALDDKLVGHATGGAAHDTLLDDLQFPATNGWRRESHEENLE